MFMYSFRLKKIPLLVCGLVIALAITIRVVSSSETQSTQTSATQISQVKSESVSVAAKTNEERINFISSYGWQVEEEPVEILEVVIPKEFDDVYQSYNEMQKLQGFNLEKYAGKRCKRYMYTINGYPDCDEPVRVSILVYKDKIIGGDIASEISGSFMHGFSIS